MSKDGEYLFTSCGSAVKALAIDTGVVDHSFEEVSCIQTVLSDWLYCITMLLPLNAGGRYGDLLWAQSRLQGMIAI